MTQRNSIKVFEDRQVRSLWDDEKEEWYFAIVDVIAVLTDSVNPTDYIKKMKARDPELAKGWGQIVTPLSLPTSGGKQKLNCASAEGIFRLIQSIPSPKAEPFKLWIAQVAAERLNQMQNPELSIHVLDSDLPWDVPKYSGVKLNNNNTSDNECYSNDTSYLPKAFGGDPGGTDGGAFIEFKDLVIRVNGIPIQHNVPKYTKFPNRVEIREYCSAWFIYNDLINTMLLLGAKRIHNPVPNRRTYGLTNTPKKQARIFNDTLAESGGTDDENNRKRDTTVHEIGHIWQIISDTNSDKFKHVDNDQERKKNHENLDECIMNYNRNREDNRVEFCIDCLEKLRKQSRFYIAPIPNN